MHIQTLLQLNIGKEENTQYRENVEKEQKKTANVCEGWDRHYNCFKDYLHCLLLLNEVELEDTRDTHRSNESCRGPEIEAQNKREDG